MTAPASSKSGTWLRRFDLLTLRLFLSVIEEGSLQRAAVREAITASAATKRIQALEEAMGQRLLERRRKDIRVTPAGATVARHAKAAIDHIAAMHGELASSTATIAGELTVTANTSTWVAGLAEDLAAFSRTHAAVTLQIRDATTADVQKAVVSSHADVGVCPLTAKLPDEVRSTPYREDRLVAVAARTHPLSQLERARLAQLLSYDFVGWSTRGSVMRSIQQEADAQGLQFKPRYRMASVDSARALVRAGLGVAIMPQCMVRPFEDESRVIAVPIDGAWARRELSALTLEGNASSPAIAELLRHLKQRADAANVR